ncbi:MAG: M12 family metallo-peptidase [Phycisphaerae bacterium]
MTAEHTRYVLGRRGRDDEPLDFDPSTVSLFRGRVEGRSGSHAYLALSDRQSMGYVDLGPGAGRFVLSSRDKRGQPLGPGLIAAYQPTGGSSLPPGVPFCGSDAHERLKKGETHPTVDRISGVEQLSSVRTMTSATGLKQLELAVDTDYEYFFLFGDEIEAVTYLSALYGAVSDIYMRDLNLRVELVYVRVWTDPDDLFNDPDPFVEFYEYWEANMGHVHRDAAQFLSGRRNFLLYGGAAAQAALCGAGYGVAGYILGFFGDPSTPNTFNWDVDITTHELGHTVGAGHTHDYGIDMCNSTTSDPRRGTIMSYCAKAYTGMEADKDNYFHTFMRQFIADHVEVSTCIAADCNENGVADSADVAQGTSDDLNGNNVPDECEDCNENGVLDPADIGVTSPDLNNNGVPDECEPDCNANGIPDDKDIADGTSTDLYGNAIPDECEEDCNANGTSDYTEIQSDMTLDMDRNARLDACQDCDDDGVPDLDQLNGAHNLWIASGLADSVIQEFHALVGVPMSVSSGAGAARVQGGQDLIITTDRRILVTSSGDDRVLEFDADGNYVGDLLPSGSGGLDYPTGLIIAPSGSLLVSSRNTNSVLAYNAVTGAPIGEFVSPGDGGLQAPFGLTFGPNGDLFVTSATDEVLEYDGVTGSFVGPFVDAINNGSLDQPRGLTFKGDGNLLVCSYASDEVLEYEGQTGAPLGKWSIVEGGYKPHDQPWGIRVGPNGQVFVSRKGGAPQENDSRMNEFDACNGLFRRIFVGGNDHGLDFGTGFDFMPGWTADCNNNQLPDDCDIAGGMSGDTNGNAIPDECEVDCNANGTAPDVLDIIPRGASYDCNCNLIPDECDLASGSSQDCDSSGVPDECEVDCNRNGLHDDCDLQSGTSNDCNGDGVPDECEVDCNRNGLHDDCDVASGSSADCDGDGVPDECEPDCNDNGVADVCDISGGTSQDCNGDLVPDECETDCNVNGIPDDCDLSAGTSGDCQPNGIPDECDLLGGQSLDVDENGIPDECECAGGLPHQELPSIDVSPDGYFGGDVAISDTHIAVGALRDDDFGRFTGSVSVYYRDDNGTPLDLTDDQWLDQAKLIASDAQGGDRFGLSVSICDDLMAIGAWSAVTPGAPDGGGAAYVFQRNDSGTPADLSDDTWVELDKVWADDAADVGLFGASVACTEDWVVVGAPGLIGAYVFRRTDGGTPADPWDDTWEQHAKLSRPAARFGETVDIWDAFIIVGSLSTRAAVYYRDDSGTPDDLSDDQWIFMATLDGSDLSRVDSVVSLDGSYAAVSQVWPFGNPAYVFRRESAGTPDDPSDDTWEEDAILEPQGAASASVGFGYHIAISGGLVAVTAPRDDEYGPESGAVYLFQRKGDGTWFQFDKSVVPIVYAGDPGENYTTVDLFGNWFAVGAPHDSSDPEPGQAFVYTTPEDCNQNFVADHCESDCNMNLLVDECEVLDGLADDCNYNLVPDECEPDEDCNTNGVRDICDIGAGTSQDCDSNSVPDECDPYDDCNTNGVQDICDLATGTSADCNDDGVPDECSIADGTAHDCNVDGVLDECVPPVDAPDHETPFVAKNRYLSIVAPIAEAPTALQVTITSLPGHEYAEGRTMWVQQPFAVTESSGLDGPTPPPTFWLADLGCTPYFTDWASYETVDVQSSAALPGGTFEIRALLEGCDLASPTSYSAPLSVSMSSAGDVAGSCGVCPCTPPQGVVDFLDVSAVVEKFKNVPCDVGMAPGVPRKARVDVANSNVAWPVPDQKIDFIDISCVVEAFTGTPCPLPGPPVADPCAP